MQTETRHWIFDTVSQLTDHEIDQLRDYLEFLTWKSQREKLQRNRTTIDIIDAMRQPPHITHEDGDALIQAINEGKQPIRFESPLGASNRKDQL